MVMVGHKQAYVMFLNPFEMHLKKNGSDNCIRFGIPLIIRILGFGYALLNWALLLLLDMPGTKNYQQL